MGAVGGRDDAARTRTEGRVPTVALTAAGWALGAAVTAMILGTPYLVFGFHSPSLHLVLGSVDACVALLVSYLVFGRFLRGRLLQDLLLAQGLLLLAGAGMGLVLFLHSLDGARGSGIDVWLPLSLRTIGAVLIAVAAGAGDRRTVGRPSRWAWAAPLGAVLVTSTALWLLRDQLPAALAASPPASAQRPVLSGHPVLHVAQAFSAICFMLASLLFTVRAVRRHDELLRWLGPACALAAFARVNYVLFPSLYSDWLYTGDLLRTGSYLLLLVGAAREISRYWSSQTRVAVLEDRRRLAREMHDGLVQELAYIRAETQLAHADDDSSERLLAACDRALDEARAAVEALGSRGEEDLAATLQRAAQQVVGRYGARLELALESGVDADPEQSHALARIVREAVSNAVRHGGAEAVRVALRQDAAGRQLMVEDDGKGFDVDQAEGGTGFGVTSMRERATGLPGSFTIESGPGRGTKVWVTW